VFPTTRERLRALILALVTGVCLLVAIAPATAQEVPPDTAEQPADPDDAGQPADPAVPAVPDVPDVTVSVDSDDAALSRTVVIILLLTVGSVAPGLLLLMTAFTRFVVVLGLTKNAIGMQTIPPAQVLVGLALFLTFFVMSPIFGQINEEAVQPLLAGEIGQSEAFEVGFAPLREFMLEQTREDDLQLFVDLAGAEQPANPDEVGATTLVPAFVISELRTAFIIGFVIFVPFLVIDLVVSAVLMSMGMMMLPPVFISMPLKLLLFVLVDGWSLVVGSLVASVNGVA
jgi:flagellar biosynthetic protein FliP